MPTDTFRDLFGAHEGKSSDKWEHYLQVYETIFAPLRDRSITLLEIGIQNGGSLEIWGEYFRNSTAIVGVDIDPQCASLRFEDERISVVIGDAKQIEVRKQIASHSASFDVIIDDGSHVSHDIIATFLRLVPLLADNGIYVVEDMHASYWKELGGELFAPYSASAFFKTMTDVINYEHWSLDKAPADLLKPFADHAAVALPMSDLQRIESVTFLNSLCIIKKTAGEPTKLGQRRIAGSKSAIVKTQPFPIHLFSRKAELSDPEDYFWAWQAQPPMEALAETNKAAMQLEEQVLAQSGQLAELRVDKTALTRELEELRPFEERVAEQSRQLVELREDKTALTRELEELRPLEERVAEQSSQLIELREGKTALTQELEDLRQRSNEQDIVLTDLRREAAHLQHQVASIHSSTSWRLTSPLRFIVQTGRFLSRLLRTLCRSFLLSSGLKFRHTFNYLISEFSFMKYAATMCVDEIKYHLPGRGTSDTQINSELQHLPHVYSVAVIYIARGQTKEELKSVDNFLASYKTFSSGLSHTLYVVYKGFETDALKREVQNSFDVPHVPIELSDDDFDLGAYIKASRMVQEDCVFLLNTHSEICDENWLGKVIRPLVDKKIGAVGCTSSFESLAALSPLFPPSPNPHVRSNAIALNRRMFVNMMTEEKIDTKFAAWLIESGPNSITNRIKLLNKKCVVVDRDGKIYHEGAWPVSGVFRHIFRQKALIIDNQIREFERAKLSQKLRMSFQAWKTSPRGAS